MTPAQARAVIFEFPGVEEGFSLGSAHFKVGGKVLTRIGVRTGADDLQIMEVDPDEADMLAAARPETFVSTAHFRNSRCVAAHMRTLDAETLRGLLERRWRKIAPKQLAGARDTAAGRSGH